jgi:hypothetical protein
MAISNYSELQTAIANWLDRSDLTSYIPDFISLAEARIRRKLRVRGIEQRSTAALVSGQAYYCLPSDFLEARNIQINTNPVRALSYRTPQQMDAEFPYDTTGTPEVYTIIGTEIQLKPIPASADNLEISYYAKLAPLSSTNGTNWLTDNAPDLLMYGSLIEAETFLVNDPRVMLWKSLYSEAMFEWNIDSKNGRYSGSYLQVRTYE